MHLTCVLMFSLPLPSVQVTEPADSGSKQLKIANSVGRSTFQLSHFPEKLPLGHVQLYAAAVAAAVGGATRLWVAHARKAPHRPVAGIAFDRPVLLHKHLPSSKGVPVMGQAVTTASWHGPVTLEPAPASAQGTASTQPDITMPGDKAH